MPAVGATQRRRRVPAWLPDVALAAVVAWIAAALFLSGHGAAMALSSDNVAPYVLFDDLFHRGLPLAGWVMPEAPFWLPDLPLAFFITATIRASRPSAPVSGFTRFATWISSPACARIASTTRG